MRRFVLPIPLSFLHLHISHTVIFSHLLNADGIPDTVPSILQCSQQPPEILLTHFVDEEMEAVSD